MLLKGKLLYVGIKIPDFRMPPIVLPICIMTELVDCLEDLLALGSFIAPNAKVNKMGLTLREAKMMVAGIGQATGALKYGADEDLVNVNIGAESVHVRIRVY